jgi:hypothetical protein
MLTNSTYERGGDREWGRGRHYNMGDMSDKHSALRSLLEYARVRLAFVASAASKSGVRSWHSIGTVI